MDYEKPEVIEEEMERTRLALTEKVCALESRVLGSVENTSSAVASVVDRVQGVFDHVEAFFSSTASGIRDGLSEMTHSVDVTGAIERNPWASVGGAALAGLVTGWMMFDRRPVVAAGTGPHEAFTPAPPRPAAAQPVKLPGWLDAIIDRISQEARKVGEAALATASASARRLIEDQLPRQMENLVDSALRPEPEPSRMPYEYPEYRRPTAV